MRRDLMAAAIDAAANILWAPASYIASGQPPVDLQAWISDAHEDFDVMGEAVKRHTHYAHIKKSDIASPAKGDLISQYGVTYAVLSDIRSLPENALIWSVPLKII